MPAPAVNPKDYADVPGIGRVHIRTQLDELDRVDCHDDLHFFLQKAWKFIDPAPFVDGWVLDALCEHLEAVVDGNIRKLLINIPPRCAKSSLISVAFPAWVWLQQERTPTSGPGVAMLHASYAYTLALRDSVKRRRLIKTAWYQRLFGQRKVTTLEEAREFGAPVGQMIDWVKIAADQDMKTRFQNTRGGESMITSVDAGVTGEGGNCFVAGTRVSTPTGAVPIEALRVSDEVLCFDHLTGKVVVSRVRATSARHARDIYRVDTVQGHSFRCTGEHPIYSPGRGYIDAAELGPGDWLYLGDHRLRAAQGDSDSDAAMRSLWSGDTKAVVRGTQGVEAGQSGCLLRQPLQSGAPCREKLPQRMSTVRCQSARAAYEVLLGRVLAHRSKRSSEENSFQVPRVWERFRRCHEVLLASMLSQSTFDAHARRGQWSLHEGFEVRCFFPRNGGDRSQTRQSSMRGMRRPGSIGETYERWQTLLPFGASHRREHPAQRAGKLDRALSELPQETSSRDLAEIERISVDSSQSVCVYDIEVEGRHNFFAEGVLVSNCIIVDDPNNAREALSDTTITATNEEWWDGAMSTRLNDTNRGAIIVVQQRLGEQDLSGHILANDKRQEWDHLVLPMHYDSRRQAATSIGWTDPRQEENELLWPQRFDREAVRDLETRLGSKWRAAGQLEQRPEPKGGGIIKREWWQLWPPGGEREGAGARPIEWPPFSFILGSLDTAYTEDELNDPSALTIWGIFEDADLVNIPTRKIQRDGSVISVYDEDYLNDLTRPKTVPKVMLVHAWAKRLELNPLVRQVEKDCKTFQVDRLLIEAKASGISVAQEIKRLYANANFSTLLNPLSRGRGASRNDKVSRLYSVQHLFEEQLVFAPERPWAEEVMDECGTFPNGTHDDRVDTVSQALRHLRAIGLLTRGAELQAETERAIRHVGRRRARVPLYPGART